MSTDPGPPDPSGQPSRPPDRRPAPPSPKQPSLVPGTVLLVVAAVLIVVVLVSPDSMPHWLRVTIAIVAICVVVALLAYTVVVFRGTTRRGSGR